MSARYTGPRSARKQTAEYTAFLNAKVRCRADSKDRALYADRGVKFLFETFEQFLEAVGKKPKSSMLLDRKDNDGNYEPGNVRWVSPSLSNENKRMTRARVEHLKRISTKGGSVARRSGQAATIAHIRWHVNRGVRKETCKLC